MPRHQCHWGVMWGSVETGPGPWSSRTTYACSRVGKAPAGGCRVAWGRHVCLRRICSQSARKSRALRGFTLGHWWHPGWDFQEGQIGNPSHQTKTSLWKAPVYVPQAMFCTLQTRPHPSQTELDLKATRRGFAQDGAVSIFAPQFPPRQPCLYRPHSVAGGQLVISPHADGSFISTEGNIDLV